MIGKGRFHAKVTAEDQDSLLAQRKFERFGDGIEFFDDWLIRQATSTALQVEFVQEAPVAADEVQLSRPYRFELGGYLGSGVGGAQLVWMWMEIAY